VTVPRREDPRDLAALRTEWSRFRGQVLDAHTGLPTLSAVQMSPWPYACVAPTDRM
jgi:hypothetical protein